MRSWDYLKDGKVMGIRKGLSLGPPGLEVKMVPSDELSIELPLAFCSSQLRHTSVLVLLHSTRHVLSHCPISMGNDSHSFLLKAPGSFPGFLKQRSASTGRGDEKMRRKTQLSPLLCLLEKGGSHRQPSCKPKGAHYFERGYILFTWTY